MSASQIIPNPSSEKYPNELNSPKTSSFKPTQTFSAPQKKGLKRYILKNNKEEKKESSPKKIYEKQEIEDFFLTRRFFLEKLKTPLVTKKKKNASELRDLYLHSLDHEKVLLEEHKATVNNFRDMQNEILEDQKYQSMLSLPKMNNQEAFQGMDRFAVISKKDEFKIKKKKEAFQNFLNRQNSIREVSNEVLDHLDQQKKVFFQTSKTGDLFLTDQQPVTSKEDLETASIKERLNFFQRKLRTPRSIIDTSRGFLDPIKSIESPKIEKETRTFQNIKTSSSNNISSMDKPKSPSGHDISQVNKKNFNFPMSRNLSASHSEIMQSVNALSPTMQSAKKFQMTVGSEFSEYELESPKSPNQHFVKAAEQLWEKIQKYSEPTTSRISTSLTSPIRKQKKKDTQTSWNRISSTPYSTDRSIEAKSPKPFTAKSPSRKFGLKTVNELGETVVVGSHQSINNVKRMKKPLDPVEVLKKTLSNNALVNQTKYKLFPEKGIRAFVSGPLPEHLKLLDGPPVDFKNLEKEGQQRELMRRKVEIYELQMLEKMGKRLPHELRGQLRKAYEDIARMMKGKGKLSSKNMSGEDLRLFWAVIHDEIPMKTLLDHKQLLEFLYGKDKEEEHKSINKYSEEIE